MNGSMSPEIAPNRAPQTIPQIKTGMCIGNSTEPALGIGINLMTCGNSKPIAIQSPVKTSFFVEDLVISNSSTDFSIWDKDLGSSSH